MKRGHHIKNFKDKSGVYLFSIGIILIVLTIVVSFVGQLNASYEFYLILLCVGITLVIVGAMLSPSKDSLGTIMFAIAFVLILDVVGSIIVEYPNISYRFHLTSACMGIILLIASYVLTSQNQTKIKNSELALGMIKTITSIGEEDGKTQALLTLTISKKDGTLFEGRLKQTFFDSRQLKKLQPGLLLWLQVTPDNQIALDEGARRSLEELYQLFEPLGRATGLITEEQLEILYNGVQSRAKVLRVVPKSSLLAEPVEVELTLLMTLSDGRKVQIESTKKVSRAVLRLFEPEQVITVRYRAESPDQFIVHVEISPFII